MAKNSNGKIPNEARRSSNRNCKWKGRYILPEKTKKKMRGKE